jgi:hypothetical protein
MILLLLLLLLLKQINKFKFKKKKNASSAAFRSALNRGRAAIKQQIASASALQQRHRDGAAADRIARALQKSRSPAELRSYCN